MNEEITSKDLWTLLNKMDFKLDCANQALQVILQTLAADSETLQEQVAKLKDSAKNLQEAMNSVNVPNPT